MLVLSEANVSSRRINRWAKPFLTLFALAFLFSSLTALAGVEVLFSPRDNIKYRIIEAINLSEECIDIATFDFTSKEIADALLNAKRKGLKIRVLVDRKLLEDSADDSQVRDLEEKGIDIKPLKGKGKGVMKNSFVIFDGRLVMVGPYQLAEDEESYNYENALFFDEPGIVETYQNEFDKLFGARSILKTTPKKSKDSLLSAVIKPSGNLLQESPQKPAPAEEVLETGTVSSPEPTTKVQPGVEEYTAPSEPKVAARDKAVQQSEIKNTPPGEKKTVETPPTPLTTESTIQPTLPIEPTPLPGGFMNISFEELDKIFGKESTLTEPEKVKLWPNYMGRYVKWTGKVTYTLLGLIKGTRIGIGHKITSGESDTDVEVKFSIKNAPKIMKIAEGDTVTYTAKLLTRPTSDEPYYVLIDGTLEKF